MTVIVKSKATGNVAEYKNAVVTFTGNICIIRIKRRSYSFSLLDYMVSLAIK